MADVTGRRAANPGPMHKLFHGAIFGAQLPDRAESDIAAITKLENDQQPSGTILGQSARDTA